MKESILKTENINKFFHDPTEFQVLKNISFEGKKLMLNQDFHIYFIHI